MIKREYSGSYIQSYARLCINNGTQSNPFVRNSLVCLITGYLLEKYLVFYQMWWFTYEISPENLQVWLFQNFQISSHKKDWSGEKLSFMIYLIWERIRRGVTCTRYLLENTMYFAYKWHKILREYQCSEILGKNGIR